VLFRSKEKDNDKVIFKDVLGESLALDLLHLFRKHSIRPYFCTPDKFYYGNIMFKLFYIGSKLLGTRSNNIDIEYVFSWRRWQKVLIREKENIVKCEIIYRDSTLIAGLKHELQHMPQLEIVDSSKYNIEITRQGVSKGKAVAVLAAHYGLQQEEIITIGDSENDVSMIEYAGLGIAMGNAPDQVKRKAGYVTGTNDEDGVAQAISKFILEV
jgi:Cof subfamily protein (haloacid dehalogenase superfamily)